MLWPWLRWHLRHLRRPMFEHRRHCTAVERSCHGIRSEGAVGVQAVLEGNYRGQLAILAELVGAETDRVHALEGIVIDNYLFGVAAIGPGGHESMVSYPTRTAIRRR